MHSAAENMQSSTTPSAAHWHQLQHHGLAANYRTQQQPTQHGANLLFHHVK
jgi:hypothetical protein